MAPILDSEMEEEEEDPARDESFNSDPGKARVKGRVQLGSSWLSKVVSQVRRSVPPYHLLRFILVLGASVRLFLHRDDADLSVAAWLLCILGLSFYSLLALAIDYRSHRFDSRSDMWIAAQIAIDTSLVSAIYLLSAKVDSDLFLFYFLPLLVAALSWSGPRLAISFLAVSMSLVVAHGLSNSSAQTSEPLHQLLLRDAIPRAFFLTTVAAVALSSTMNIRRQRDAVIRGRKRYGLLLRQQARRVESLNALNEATARLLKRNQLSQESVLANAAETAYKVADLIGPAGISYAYVAMVTEDRKHLEFRASHPSQHLADLRERLGIIDITGTMKGVSGRGVDTSSSVVVDDTRSDQDYIEYIVDIKSTIVVPIRRGEETVGVIGVEHTAYKAFDAECIRQLTAFATAVGLTLDNLELGAGQQRQRLALETLHKVALGIAESPSDDVGRLAKLVLESLAKLVAFQRATLQAVSGDKRSVLATVGFADWKIDSELLKPISLDPLVKAVISSRRPFVLTNTAESKLWEKLDATKDVHTWLGIPLWTGNDLVGLITVDNLSPVSDEFQRWIFELYASYSAHALGNALRLRELREARDFERAQARYYRDTRPLRMIGLVYGEAIHFATNKLQLTRADMQDIHSGLYGDLSQRARDMLVRGCRNIDEYFDVLREMAHSQRKSVEFTTVRVSEILDQVIERTKIRSGIEVKRDYSQNEPQVLVPRDQLRQVFFVVVQNAVQSMARRGGILSLSVNRESDGVSEFCLVSIADTGIGIGKTALAELFVGDLPVDRRGRRRGTGTGLKWARSFMLSYGGSMDIESEVQVGTTVYLKLPVVFKDLESEMAYDSQAEGLEIRNS